ncbi:putative N-acetyltransferase YafP [Clostridium sp. C105KSO13]|nr:putative N-acetyltransferase YafP [Clostridium sp. C105KSO13]
MQLREYKSTDCEQLAELFYQTVHSVNAKDYTEEQLDVWATGKVNLQEWDSSFLKHKTIVAIEDNKIVGFGDMDNSGYLDRLFVHKDYQSRGIATAICDELEYCINEKQLQRTPPLQQNHFFNIEDTVLLKNKKLSATEFFS